MTRSGGGRRAVPGAGRRRTQTGEVGHSRTAAGAGTRQGKRRRGQEAAEGSRSTTGRLAGRPARVEGARSRSKGQAAGTSSFSASRGASERASERWLMGERLTGREKREQGGCSGGCCRVSVGVRVSALAWLHSLPCESVRVVVGQAVGRRRTTTAPRATGRGPSCGCE